jgi:hypothetical protein
MIASVWIALAEVRQVAGAGVLLDRNEAFVNAMAMARSAEDFRERVQDALRPIGFDLLELSELETLDSRLQHSTLTASLNDLAESVRLSGEVGFGTFHTWTADDSES